MFPAGSGAVGSAAPPAGSSAAKPGSCSELCGPVQIRCRLPQAGCSTLRSDTMSTCQSITLSTCQDRFIDQFV